MTMARSNETVGDGDCEGKKHHAKARRRKGIHRDNAHLLSIDQQKEVTQNLRERNHAEPERNEVTIFCAFARDIFTLLPNIYFVAYQVVF